MNDSIAVSGTRRAMKELVDGTIRVQIDIDPEFRDDFLRLFSDIDMAVALTPLQHAPIAQPAEHLPRKQEEARSSRAGGSENWKNLGPLAQSAIMLCKEPLFQEFVAENLEGPKDGEYGVADEHHAAEFVKKSCNIQSRKDLDTVDGGRTKFGSLMARYKDWQLRRV